jgi:ribosomal subunit interface protein
LKFQIVSRHAEIEKDLEARAREKIERLQRHLDRPMDVQLVLSPDVDGKAGTGKRGSAGRPGASESLASVDDVPTRRTDRDQSIADDSAHAELIVTIPREKPFVATATGESYSAAIDLVIDKMDRQLVRHKERLHGRRRKQR